MAALKLSETSPKDLLNSEKHTKTLREKVSILMLITTVMVPTTTTTTTTINLDAL